MRTFFLLLAALVGGYLYGFHDARTHELPLQRRLIGEIAAKAGGTSRSRVGGDIDAKMRGAER